MKKVVLALAVTAVSAQAVANDLGIYKDDLTEVSLFGEIRARFSKTIKAEDPDTDRDARFSMGSSRIGLQGTHKLNDNVTALGYIRLRYDDNELSSKDNDFDVDKSWMGAATNFGTFKVGRIGSVQDDDMTFFDVTSEFGGAISPHDAAAGTGVQDGVLDYTWNNDNVSVHAQYFGAATQVDIPDSNNPSDTMSANLDHGFAVGGSWTSDSGLGLHLAYTLAHVDEATRPSSSPLASFDPYDKKTTSVGISYTRDALFLAAVTSNITTEPEVGRRTKDNDLGLSAKYTWDSGVGTYMVYEREHQKTFAEDPIREKQYTAGVEYWPLKDQLLAFSEITRMKTDDGVSEDTITAWAVGTRFYF